MIVGRRRGRLDEEHLLAAQGLKKLLGNVTVGLSIYHTGPKLSAQLTRDNSDQLPSKFYLYLFIRPPPVVRNRLIVPELPDAGDQWMMKAAFRPRYRFRSIGRSGEDVVGVVLDNIMLDTAAAFGMRQCFARFPILAERRMQAAGTLSGGQQQMLAISMGFTSNPKLIVLDEPSLGLAPIVIMEIGRTLQGLRDSGLTVLLIEVEPLILP